MYACIILLPATLFHLNIAYRYKTKTSIKWFLIYLPAVFFIALLPTDLFIAGLEPTYWGWGKVVGPAYSWFQAYVAIYCMIYIVFIIYQFISETSPRLKNEILCLAISNFPAVFIGCIIIIILTIFHVTKFNIMVHAICVLWHCLAISVAMLSKRFYDVYAHLPWFNFEKRQLQRNMTDLIQSGAIPLDHKKIVETLNNLMQVDIAIHTQTDVYASHGCDPVFAEFSADTIFTKESEVLIRHELSPKQPEYEILSRHKCDILAPLFFNRQYIGAIRLGAGITDKLYSNYDVTLIYNLLQQLRLALVCVNSASAVSSTVVLHQLRGKVCSVQKTGDVRIYVVDYENRSVSHDEAPEADCCKQTPMARPLSTTPKDLDGIPQALSRCPACGGSRTYTAINMTCIFDHQKKQIVEVAEMDDLARQGTHGCFTCRHQWVAAAEPAADPPTNIIHLDEYKRINKI